MTSNKGNFWEDLFAPLDFAGVPLCPREIHSDVWVTQAPMLNGNPWLVQYFGHLDFSNVWAPFYEEPDVDLREILKFCENGDSASCHFSTFFEFCRDNDIIFEDHMMKFFAFGLRNEVVSWFKSLAKGEISSFSAFLEAFCRHWGCYWWRNLYFRHTSSMGVN
jgi:hypothetical protein